MPLNFLIFILDKKEEIQETEFKVDFKKECQNESILLKKLTYFNREK